MTAYVPFPSLDPIFAAVARSNAHDGLQRAIAMDPRRSIVCLAPAGSGKTTELILRMLACLSISRRPEEVLAITFTTLAAGEIKERLMDALALAASGIEPEEEHEKPLYDLAVLVLKRDAAMGWNLLLNPSRLRIMTFDSFSAMLAAKNPVMSGLGGGNTTDDPHLLYRQAVLETLGSVNDLDTPEELRVALEAVLGFAKNQFEKLVPLFATLLSKRDQWAHEIGNFNVPMMEQALRGLTSVERSDAYAQLRTWHIDSLINTITQASSMLEGFEWAATAPVAGAPGYDEFMAKFAGFALTKDGDLRASVNVKNGFPAGHPLTKDFNAVLKGLKGSDEAVVYSEALKTLVDLPDAEYPDLSAEMCKHFSTILFMMLGNLHLAFDDTATLDFPEVAFRAIRALGDESTGEVGDALLDEDRICHLLVDEVQDSSPNQYLLLLKLTAHWGETSDEIRSMFFCGDIFQSIYLFRNAVPETFNKIVSELKFGNQKLELARLVVNFRSAPGVVEWNNNAYSQVFANSKTPFVPSVAAREGAGGMTVRPINSGAIGEAKEVVDQIEGLIQAEPESSIAILVRSRSHMKHILPELKARGIKASGQNIDPITESSPVSEVVGLIRSLWHIADRTSWFTLLRSAFVGLSWADCVAVGQGDRIVIDALRSEKVNDLLSVEGKVRVAAFLVAYDAVRSSSRGDDLAWAAKALWVSLGGPATVDDTEVEDVLTVFNLLLQHTSTGCLEKPQAFFRAVEKLFASPKPGSVMVMTIHASKGLEFDHVIIPALNSRSGSDDTPLFYWRRVDDTFVVAPNPGPGFDELSAENRLFKYIGSKVNKDVSDEVSRLAYVMTTRAKKTCTLYATFEKLDEDTMASYATGSVLECLWPAVEEEVIAMAPGFAIKEEVKTQVPSKARLLPGFTPVLPANLYIPASSNDQMPTEADMVDETKETQGSDLRRRIEGIVLHKVLELIGQSGLAAWSVDRIKGKAKAIAAMLSREGYPSRDIVAGVDRVIWLACNTIQSDAGQWILKSRDSGGQEVEVSAYRNGRWINRILDTSFEEEGVYWIIDWKSSEPAEGQDVDQFIAMEVERYEAKMEEYKAAVIDAGITIPVKMALFFPAITRLKDVA